MKLKISKECTQEEMAVITAAIRAYKDSPDGAWPRDRPSAGWRFSGKAHWHRLDFYEAHSLRNSRIADWRRVGLHRFG